MEGKGEEPIVMSAEELWGCNEEIQRNSEEPFYEITDFDHKVARDMKQFSEYFNKNPNILDNHVIIHNGSSSEEEEMGFDILDKQ